MSESPAIDENILYCLPGTMCDERLWQFLIPLMKGVTLQHVSLPKEESIDAIVTALAQQLPAEPINLLGFSMGGYVASRFALKYPERVAHLMVVSNAAKGLQEEEVKQRKQALHWVLEKGYKGIPLKKAKSMLAERNQRHDYLLKVIQDMDAALGEAVLIQQLSSSMERPDQLDELASSGLSACFCLGQEDVLIGQDDRYALSMYCAEKPQNSAIEVFIAHHCGHMIPLEQPLWLCQKIKHFFGF